MNIKFIDDKYVYFGSFIQNSGEKEPIKWKIVNKEDNILTLIADVILYNMDFDIRHSDYSKSQIRKYLNNEFLNLAFCKEEQELIIETKLEDDVIDKVYLPSKEELVNKIRTELFKKTTLYAINNKASSCNEKCEYQGNGWYWTRTPYKPPYDPNRSNHVWYVTYRGELNSRPVWGYDIGVVPMIRVKI